jgi:hypothetical protein
MLYRSYDYKQGLQIWRKGIPSAKAKCHCARIFLRIFTKEAFRDKTLWVFVQTRIIHHEAFLCSNMSAIDHLRLEKLRRTYWTFARIIEPFGIKYPAWTLPSDVL